MHLELVQHKNWWVQEKKLMDTFDVEDAGNSGQDVLQVENENATKNWTLIAH